MINYEHYAYKVIWSMEDEEYIGLCAEFPSLSFLHKKQVKALEGINDLVHSIIEDMESNFGTNPIVPRPEMPPIVATEPQEARPFVSETSNLLVPGEPPVILICPAISRADPGLVVPIPTLPVL